MQRNTKRKPKFNPRNQDGSFKTIDRIMRGTMTVLQYGRMLSMLQRGQKE